MDTQRINRFLANIALHNNREWFQEHKKEYEACRDSFQTDITQLIGRLATLDPDVAHLTAKDCCYRFYRDVRFSADKSPYKRHLGAYICSAGRKSLRGGYYVHVQPGHSLLAFGCYWLPNNILTSCRNELLVNSDAWLKAVENGRFVKTFGYANEGHWEDEDITERGFGLNALKTMPKGFPKDSEQAQYLRMKDYCCWRTVPDDFFAQPGWMDQMLEMAEVAKPMMDMINSVVDDYI